MFDGRKQVICDENRPFCFISYSSRNKDFVFDVVDNLAADGFNIWIDKELENHIGAKWTEIVHRTILNVNCKAILWFVSSDSLSSGPVAEELTFANKAETVIKHGGKPIVIYPIEIEKIKPSNNIQSFCDNIIQKLTAEGKEDELKAAKQIAELVVDNKIKRLSVEKTFTKEGRQALAASMRNDGLGDIVDHPFMKIYVEYYNKFKREYMDGGRSRILGDIETELLPYVKRGDSEEPLVEIVEKSFEEAEDKFNCLLTGRGGAGKTVALFCLMRFFAERGIAAFYIPLYELGGELTITDYILKKLELRSAALSQDFESFISSKKAVFLLDGLNEIQTEHEQSVKNCISVMMDRGVNLIITSRSDQLQQKYRYLFEKYIKFEISPIPQFVINNYLEKYGNEPIEDAGLAEILSSPLMLKIYTLQQNADDGQFFTLKNLWKDGNNAGRLIWDFLLTECGKRWNMHNSEDDTYLFALLYIAPYVAWRMVNAGKMSINLAECNAWIMNASDFYSEAYKNCFVSHGDGGYNTRFFENIPYFSEIDGNLRPLNILTDSGLIIQNQNNISFNHQIFRDSLCAVHCLHSIALKPHSESECLSTHVLPDEILGFICELDDTGAIEGYWQSIDSDFECSSGSLTRVNLIKLFNVRNGDLSQTDFSNKDLREISLNGNEFVSENGAAYFCGARISGFTFAPPAVHSSYICCLAVTDDFHYIVTGSACGEIIVFDIENSCPVGEIITLCGDSRPVKSIDILGGKVWICFENGLLYICSFEGGKLETIFETRVISDGKITGVSVSANRYYALSEDGKMYFSALSGLADAAEFRLLSEIGGAVCILAYRTDTLFVGTADGKIVRLNTVSRRITAEWCGHKGEITSLALNEMWLYSSATDRTVLKRNANTGMPENADRWKWNRDQGKSVNKLLTANRSPYIFSCSADGNLLKARADCGEAESVFKFSATKGAVHCMAFSRDGKFIIADGADNVPVIYEADSRGKLYRDFKSVLSGAVILINVSDNGRYALAQSVKGYGIECVVWDLERGVPVYTPIFIPSLWGKTKVLTDDGSKAFLGLGEHMDYIKFGNYAVADKISSKQKYNGWLYGIALDESRNILWSGADDKKIYKLSIDGYEMLSEPVNYGNDTTNCFACCRLSDAVFFGDWSGKVTKINASSGEKSLSFGVDGYCDWINDLCLSEDEKYLYGALDDGRVVKWDVANGKVIGGLWQYHGIHRWDKPGITLITIDRQTDCLTVLTNDFCVFLLDKTTFAERECVNLKTVSEEISGVRSASLIKGTADVLIGTENGDMYMYGINDKAIKKRCRRIKNVCLTGCDFRYADFSENESIKEQLADSGAVVD